MSDSSIKNEIANLLNKIADTQPLYAFVTSNQLSGYQHLPFEDAVLSAKKELQINPYPNADQFKRAYENAEISKDILKQLLLQNGIVDHPEACFEQLAKESETLQKKYDALDQLHIKWLSSFLDEGVAEWAMPFREKGFYAAWKKLAATDKQIRKGKITELPKTAEENILFVLNRYPKEKQKIILKSQLLALPGWLGYIKHREKNKPDWQKEYPITPLDFLAVRLGLAYAIDYDLLFKAEVTSDSHQNKTSSLSHIWLNAWEQSWQIAFEEKIKNGLTQNNELDSQTTKDLDAQWVFCIDTRSERIRRIIESNQRNETFGYAGFFGLAMKYKCPDTQQTYNACPPILDPAFTAKETPLKNQDKKFKRYKKQKESIGFYDYFLKRLKNMLPAAFGFVEGAGLLYGFHLIKSTVTPAHRYKLGKPIVKKEQIAEPELFDSNQPVALNTKIEIVKNAFEMMGWKKFAPLVIFAGHGSTSTNNPFASSLDCGACAAHAGGPNARLLAKLANSFEVRKGLREQYNINIPEDTLFIGAQHNTTTEKIELYYHTENSKQLKRIKEIEAYLEQVQQSCLSERLGNENNLKKLASKKGLNWAEVRPEWGLAKNAGFLIGPRSLSQQIDLGTEVFLHSYDYKLDIEAKALENILLGPMVVTQWINNHYYFSTVDNENLGGGSKIFHNITGKFGVIEGNMGDLKRGLPQQSLFQNDKNYYHHPLRLSVYINAPKQMVQQILDKHQHLNQLAINKWIHIFIIDPENKNKISNVVN
ncbi:DUF2309 domain-containing protein [Mesonia sp. HuA40]|uniref:DUF2309 domain-containing protein n=1 Tax=Mesonia sp. HuA40 TaxID=2602761 RepID=UPI0011C98252|nr:DUF2309 domain-containing protein [Mesonia sp. HuA40]TXK71211.1 DUF2309 domain-containing protein [Mesonia sp. HuA40]